MVIKVSETEALLMLQALLQDASASCSMAKVHKRSGRVGDYQARLLQLEDRLVSAREVLNRIPVELD